MKHEPIVLDANFVTAQIERLKADYPDMLADAELLEGMIQGETDFDRVLDRIVDRILDADTTAEAIELRLKNLRERRDRFKRRSDGYRSVAVNLMKAAGKRKHHMAEVSLSIPSRTRVVVNDINALPQGAYTMERLAASDTVLRSLIESADKDHPIHQAARIETLPETLTVRAK